MPRPTGYRSERLFISGCTQTKASPYAGAGLSSFADRERHDAPSEKDGKRSEKVVRLIASGPFSSLRLRRSQFPCIEGNPLKHSNSAAAGCDADSLVESDVSQTSFEYLPRVECTLEEFWYPV